MGNGKKGRGKAARKNRRQGGQSGKKRGGVAQGCPKNYALLTAIVIDKATGKPVNRITIAVSTCKDQATEDDLQNLYTLPGGKSYTVSASIPSPLSDLYVLEGPASQSFDLKPNDIENAIFWVREDPKITVGWRDHDFGRIRKGSQAVHDLIITSTGSTKLTSINVNLTGDQFSIANPGGWARSLAPRGGTTTVKIEFKPTDYGEKTANIVVTSSAANENPIGITVKGSGPKLTALQVNGASQIEENRYWVLRDDVATVTVTAVTEPPDTPVTWSGGTSTSNQMVQNVSLTAVAVVPVKATLDCEKSVTIEIYDLVSLSCPLPVSIGKHKAYVSSKTTCLTAQTSPDEQKVWDLLEWSEGTAGSAKNLRDVVLSPVGDRTVTVKLGSKTLPVELHICQWPRLEIKEVTFECHKVCNDGAAEIGVPFDKKWKKGRPAPAANQKAADSQSPVCFTRNKKIKLSAEFDVTQLATDNETVSVKANLGFGELEANVSVASGAATATMALTESKTELADKVDLISAWDITWTSVLEDNSTWVTAGTSTSPLYVLLGDPGMLPRLGQAKIYFTLLHVSCDSAKGKNTDDDVVTESFKPFANAKGTGNGFVRKGDGLRMSYYNKGCDTISTNDAQTTEGLLSNPEATGRCGGWATLLVHMWAMHGITATSKRWYIRADQTDLTNWDLRFLVKNCKFSAKGSWPTEAYTHKVEDPLDPLKTEVTKEDGLPGHGQDNPQFDFGDHVVVKYGGKYYDPSYGVGPYDNDDAYLSAALDGLGKYPHKKDFDYKTIPQQIPSQCVPYQDGFAEHTIILNPFDFYAKQFGGRTGAQLFPFCTFVPSRASAAAVSPGDQVTLWNRTNLLKSAVISPLLTLADLATGYGLTDANALFPHCQFDPHRDAAAEVKTGDKVAIFAKLKTADQQVMGPLVTLADVAAKHSTTEDKIFDHPKNGPLKALRKDKTKLETGDTVVVPRDLDSNCKPVIGHDI